MIIDSILREIIERARVARLATVDSQAVPHLVPVVFAFDGKNFIIPVDEKKKSVKPEQLKRLRNIQSNPNVALLVDEYREDWSQLKFLLIQGKASILSKGSNAPMSIHAYKMLSTKYPQYRKVGVGKILIIVAPEKIISWKNE